MAEVVVGKDLLGKLNVARPPARDPSVTAG
jgi:hypothetical protein